ncbi:MAG: glycine cleavage system protein GcvH [Phyllobacteriaceae bacterium]|nr:glycine cleavage system protein GcvH [Phyllobacteriaceae bacterium]
MKLYTKDHEWIVLEGEVATFGITTYAQEQLGDVVFVELPDAGKALTKGAEAAVVESVKAASEVYAPLDGEVIEANGKLSDDPSLVNLEPETGGWFVKMKVPAGVDTADLMDEAAYEAYVQTL